MQQKLNGAANRAATWELHKQGLSQRKIGIILGLSKTRVSQFLAEQKAAKKNARHGQVLKTKALTTLDAEKSTEASFEEKLLSAARGSVVQALEDEREVQREQVLDDLQYIRNWSIETAEKVRSGQVDLNQLQLELGSLKVLSAILMENNRQRIDLFNLNQKPKSEDTDMWRVDYFAAAKAGGLDAQ